MRRRKRPRDIERFAVKMEISQWKLRHLCFKKVSLQARATRGVIFYHLKVFDFLLIDDVGEGEPHLDPSHLRNHGHDVTARQHAHLGCHEMCVCVRACVSEKMSGCVLFNVLMCLICLCEDEASSVNKLAIKRSYLKYSPSLPKVFPIPL